MGDGTLVGACPVSVPIFLEWKVTIASALPIRRGLGAIVTLAEGIQDELDPAGYTQLLEDPVDVVPDGMFLYVQLLTNFTVLQSVGDEMNHFFLATRQQWHSLGIIYMKRLRWVRASMRCSRSSLPLHARNAVSVFNRSGRNTPKHDAVGHLSADGRVHVFNTGIIEKLVRAGLRARV